MSEDKENKNQEQTNNTNNNNILKQILAIIVSIIVIIIAFVANYFLGTNESTEVISNVISSAEKVELITLDNMPDYSGEPYVYINDNEPYFTDEEKEFTEPFEIYSNLDNWGRAQVAYANICTELMPIEERKSLSYEPTGWHSITYDFISGGYLYNRCHLIAFSLAGENNNELNLITGTKYLNTNMQEFEDIVYDFIKYDQNSDENVDTTTFHVLYRVTPIYEGENDLASGIEMEAYSVEDSGEGVSFNVYLYNVQPGVTIDYATGDSWESN